MKKSILRLAAFSILPFLVICYAVYLTGQETDDFYKRFTSKQQNALILGSSRAASVDPQILDSIVRNKFQEVNFYNYAFTWAHSPYGPKYLESIKKKVADGSTNGFFIVTVEPTALMVDKNKPDDPNFYVENDKSVAKTSLVSTNPNIEYLLESYNFSITHVVNKKVLREKNAIAKAVVLDNGKVDINILKSVPEKEKNQENKKKMDEFQKRINSLKISSNRIQYLSQTIDFLKQHGKVIVVRMPISKTPYSIENKAYPDFDKKMVELCAKQKITYINYNKFPNEYQWGDEVHLIKESMRQFSADLGKDIVKNY